MTDNNHPIIPPPELVAKWFLEAKAMPVDQWVTDVATQAARWGADMELEACCQEVHDWYGNGRRLRDARRPKPPSLKEQSIALIDKIQGNKEMWDIRDLDVIRQALESLPS